MFKLYITLIALLVTLAPQAAYIAGDVFLATDASGTNAVPTNTFNIASTNASLKGILRADSAILTNNVRTIELTLSSTDTSQISIDDEHGNAVNYLGVATPLKWGLSAGSTVSPVTAIGNMFKISKVEEIDATGMANPNASDQIALINVQALNTTNSNAQVNAIFGAAQTRSIIPLDASNNPDAAGIIGAGKVIDSGVGRGMGAYLEGRRDTTTGKAQGAESRVINYTATPGVFATSEPSDTMGLWVSASGLTNSAVGVQLGGLSGMMFDVGFAAAKMGTSNTVKTAFLYDGTDAVTSYVVTGSHTTGIDLSGGTYSGNAIDASAKAVAIGTIELDPEAANTTSLTVRGITTGSSTTPALNVTHILNTSGSVDGVFNFVVTNTAAGASTDIFRVAAGASGTTELLKVDLNGLTTSAGSIVINNSASSLLIGTRGRFNATADGEFRLLNNAQTAGGSLNFRHRVTPTAAPTIASAGTIAPVDPIVFVSGVEAIATITAPSPISATGGQITIIPTGIFTTTTAGNIALASTAVVSKALIMTYDQATAKWYPSY